MGSWAGDLLETASTASPPARQPNPCRAPLNKQGKDDPSAQRPLDPYASLCLPKHPAGLVSFAWIVRICFDGIGGYWPQERVPTALRVVPTARGGHPGLREPGLRARRPRHPRKGQNQAREGGWAASWPPCESPPPPVKTASPIPIPLPASGHDFRELSLPSYHCSYQMQAKVAIRD